MASARAGTATVDEARAAETQDDGQEVAANPYRTPPSMLGVDAEPELVLHTAFRRAQGALSLAATATGASAMLSTLGTCAVFIIIITAFFGGDRMSILVYFLLMAGSLAMLTTAMGQSGIVTELRRCDERFTAASDDERMELCDRVVKLHGRALWRLALFGLIATAISYTFLILPTY